MVDRIKPLKFENPSSGGGDLDFLPTETEPSEDYISAKGVALEGLDTYLLEKIGGIVKVKIPDFSMFMGYSSNNLASVEFYNGLTQTPAQRIARGDFTYTSSNLTQEVWKVYSQEDGATVIRTITITHSYTANNLQSTTVVES